MYQTGGRRPRRSRRKPKRKQKTKGKRKMEGRTPSPRRRPRSRSPRRDRGSSRGPGRGSRGGPPRRKPPPRPFDEAVPPPRFAEPAPEPSAETPSPRKPRKPPTRKPRKPSAGVGPPQLLEAAAGEEEAGRPVESDLVEDSGDDEVEEGIAIEKPTPLPPPLLKQLYDDEDLQDTLNTLRETVIELLVKSALPFLQNQKAEDLQRELETDHYDKTLACLCNYVVTAEGVALQTRTDDTGGKAQGRHGKVRSKSAAKSECISGLVVVFKKNTIIPKEMKKGTMEREKWIKSQQLKIHGDAAATAIKDNIWKFITLFTGIFGQRTKGQKFSGGIRTALKNSILEAQKQYHEGL